VTASARPETGVSELSFELVHTLEQLQEDWVRLGRESDNLFSTWEWLSTWWRCYGSEGALRIASCRAPDGHLVAIVPLHRQLLRGVQVLRFLGHGPGDELGPVCEPRDRPGVAAALPQFLAETVRDWNLFLGEQLPGSENWGALPGASVLERRATPVMRPPEGGWEAFLASRSANFRQQVRRRERNVFRRHDARYRLVTRSDRLQQELDTLFRLHRLRWARDRTGFTAYETFHRQFAELAQESGWLRLWFLELGEQPIAAWYGFRFSNVEYYYQAGRDPSAAHEAAGFVLLAHTIRTAIHDGVRAYRLLQGGEHYKYRFATEDLGLQTVGVANGLAGRLALFVGSSSLRWNPFKILARRSLSRNDHDRSAS
jgi:CelD/BcsL family acetyltransferase involved in cellulose biosynthesis